MLGALGETINIMTLGGLALAVGILVDDATVEIENINRNLKEGKETEQAILDGAAQIAVPAFVSTLLICIVFVLMFFMGGVAKYLFVPLAEAVIFAMLAVDPDPAPWFRPWPSTFFMSLTRPVGEHSEHHDQMVRANLVACGEHRRDRTAKEHGPNQVRQSENGGKTFRPWRPIRERSSPQVLTE